jgi:hypothetical protein
MTKTAVGAVIIKTRVEETGIEVHHPATTIAASLLA